jgi:hypothetical protein
MKGLFTGIPNTPIWVVSIFSLLKTNIQFRESVIYTSNRNVFNSSWYCDQEILENVAKNASL